MKHFNIIGLSINEIKSHITLQLCVGYPNKEDIILDVNINRKSRIYFSFESFIHDIFFPTLYRSNDLRDYECCNEFNDLVVGYFIDIE